jgi:DNA (cytosine-5)-methyltransferase 1
MGSLMRASSTKDQYDIVDLFAGPGGLDVAAGWLGLDAVGIEYDPNALETRRAADLGNAEYSDVTHPSNKPSAFPGVHLLAGGPPCQTFTVAGNGTGRRDVVLLQELVDRMGRGKSVAAAVKDLEDERTGLVLQPLKWALRAVQDGNPYEAIVLEQVPAVLGIWQSVATVLRRNDYEVWCDVLNAEEYGVPQTRRRAILIARLHGKPKQPTVTHHRFVKGTKPATGGGLFPWVSMGKALGRDGFEVVSNYGTGGDPKARGRRSSNEPAFTVTGKITRNRLEGPGVVEGANDRFVLDEAGQLQTFPKKFPWRGKDQAQQIGNAIPPRLAAHVLAEALDIRLDARKLDSAVSCEWKESRTINIRMAIDGVESEPPYRPARESRQAGLVAH